MTTITYTFKNIFELAKVSYCVSHTTVKTTKLKVIMNDGYNMP